METETKSKYFFELAGNSILAGLFLAFIYYLYFYQPVAFVYCFTTEDMWSEYGTFIFWLFTFFMLAWALVKYSDFRKPGHFIFAFIAFLMAMEEISWGQRIFQIASPTFFQTVNTQSELNLHNIVEGKQYFPYVGNLLLLGGFILPVMARLSVKLRYYCNRLGIPLVAVRHWPFFFLPVYLLDYAKYFFIFEWDHELAELFLSIAVSVMTLDLVMKIRMGNRACGRTTVMATIGMIGMVWLLTAPLVQFSFNTSELRWNFNYSGSTAFPRHGMYRQAGMLFDYMARHPEYLDRESFYYHGLLLLKLGRDQEGREIHEKALQEQKQLEWEEPDNPEVYRNTGKILHVLNRTTEAKQAYLQAVKLEGKRLSGTSDPEMEALYRWSLGKTLFAMGHHEAAKEQLVHAAEVSPLKRWKKNIHLWEKFERRRVDRLLPPDMAIIDADFPQIPRNKQLEEWLAHLDPRELKWSLGVAGGNFAKLLFPSDDPEALRVTIKKATTKNSWDIQLKYPRLEVRSNQGYRVQIRGRADSPRSIYVGFARAHEPWTGLGLYQKIALTPEWQSFQADFTATGDEDNAHIYFDLGGSDISVEVSGVILLSLDPRELKWLLGVTGGNIAKLVFPSDDPKALRIAIEKAKTKNSWDIQLKHPRLEVRSNQSYRVQLRARADSPRSMFVGFARAHKPWTGLGLYQEIALTTEWQSFQADFTATGDEDNAHIYFDLGGSDISVEVSEVVLSRLPDDHQSSG